MPAQFVLFDGFDPPDVLEPYELRADLVVLPGAAIGDRAR